MPRSTCLALRVVLGLALAVGPSFADDAATFEQAKSSYDAGRYEEARDRFRALLDPGHAGALRDPALVERSRALYVACLFATRELGEADRQIEAIYRSNPTFVPDAASLPGAVIARFSEVRTRLRRELEDEAQRRLEEQRRVRAREAETRRREEERHAALVKLAGEERVVVRNSRWIALLPFGVGQLQNRQQALGYTLLVLEGLLAGTSAVSLVWHNFNVTSEDDPGVNLPALEEQRQTLLSVNRYSSVGFGVLALAGVLHAQVTFVPEHVEVRRRKLPDWLLTVNPSVSATREGLELVVRGAF